jgi:uncharacterized NAD(P)/FAD-binding protein YdhS
MRAAGSERRGTERRDQVLNQSSTTEPVFTYSSASAAAALAHRAAARLREALTAAGFDVDRDFPALHGDTTTSDEPFVTLGRFSPASAEEVAALVAVNNTI